MAAQKSTIVRSGTSRLRYLGIRAAFAVLERCAPGVSGRWASRLWFTIPSRTRRAGSPPASPGEPFEVEVFGARVRGHVWGDPSGPVVALVHGWGGYAGQLSALVDPLVATGHRVISYDALSHGASDPGPHGRRGATIIEFAEALRAVAERFGPLEAVVAHSLGATATGYAVRRGLRVRRLVLVSAMVEVVSYTATFTRMLGAGERTRHRLAAAVESRVGDRLDSFDLATLPDVVSVPPALVIHDRDDPETSWEAAEHLVGGWPGADLVTTTGLGHNRLLRDPAVMTHVVDYLARAVERQAAVMP